MMRRPPLSSCDDRNAKWIPSRAAAPLPLLTFFYVVSHLVSTTLANEQLSADVAFFESKIRPVLVEHCYDCHSAGAKKVQGGLLLDTRAGIRQGGDSGPAVVPEQPAESLLLDALRYESFEMPPSEKLPSHVIANFEQWIRGGAADPREGEIKQFKSSVDPDQARNFWAFQPPRKTPVPEVRDEAWPRTKVDRYLLSRLEAEGIRPAPDADRSSLLRRIYFTLIGLPPSPSEIEEFCDSTEPLEDLLAAVVDRLLDTEQFGQRWGRHWLDVVRYADSSGGGRSAIFPHAWRYRDYVIDAFNSDMPYDQFLQEQIAGDLLPSNDWQERRRRITATAFLVLGPTNFELQDKDVLEMDIVDEQLDTLGKALLGMTIGCARCHDHKFDPIPTKDYYALAGIFKSSKFVLHDNVSTYYTAKLPMTPAEQLTLAEHSATLAGLKREQEVLNAALRSADKKLATLALDEQTNYQGQRAQLVKKIASLKQQITELKAQGPARPVAMAVAEGDKVGDIPLAIRGVARNKGPIVPRGTLQACAAAEFPAIPDSASGRRELAQWITDPEHPLTARVYVNRVWYWLFGRGLVRTVDNFGATGAKPSHPELLDYLTLQFVEGGWSTKALVRELILSRAYGMSTDLNAQAKSIDPDNRLLWRMNRNRLDAESIRDAMLSISGRLDETAGGPTIAPGTEIEYGYVFNSRRRSVYLPIFRNSLPELFEAFDFADPNIQAGLRSASTTAPQAHYLMNHPFVIELATTAAKQLLERSALTQQARIDTAFLEVLGRLPTPQEADIAGKFLSEASDTQRWAVFYQTLLQSIDFRYLN